MNTENAKLDGLQEKTGYQFQDQKLLIQALSHSSFINEKKMNRLKNNERLEFLGDSVLELVSSEFLYRNYPEMYEGDMTKLRASLVCEPTLAICAREMDLGRYLALGKGEDSTGGRKRESILSDALEALIGAIYLDGGFTNAKDFIIRFILSDIDNKKLFFDSKTILQELIQGNSKETLSYQLISEEGPDHNKEFCVAVLLGGKELATGRGRTKKAAEQDAAYQSILKIR